EALLVLPTSKYQPVRSFTGWLSRMLTAKGSPEMTSTPPEIAPAYGQTVGPKFREWAATEDTITYHCAPWSPAPVSPFAPGSPFGPCIPCGPTAPCGPAPPFAPGGPCGPASPFAPCRPFSPS